MIKVCGYRVLVKPEKVERVSKGGIVVMTEDSQEAKLADAGNQFGTVVGLGATCWQGEAFGQPWCKIGDRVMFAKHSGRFVYDPTETDDELSYLIMNDTDVLAVVEASNG